MSRSSSLSLSAPAGSSRRTMVGSAKIASSSISSSSLSWIVGSEKIASSTWYVLGVLLVFAFFPERIALASTLVLAVADPVGNLVGRTVGTRPFGTGTWEGTTGLVAASFLAAVIFVPVVHAGVAALAVGIAETREWRYDDNLTVPVTAAIVLSILAAAGV